MAELTIGGRVIPLSYTCYEMIEIERALGCTAYQLNDKVLGLRQTDEDDPTKIEMEIFHNPDMKENLGKLIRILGNAGLEDAGQEPDLTDRWVLRALKPGKLNEYISLCLAEMNAGMESEIPPAEEDGPVDVTLETIQKKKEKAD